MARVRSVPMDSSNLWLLWGRRPKAHVILHPGVARIASDKNSTILRKGWHIDLGFVGVSSRVKSLTFALYFNHSWFYGGQQIIRMPNTTQPNRDTSHTSRSGVTLAISPQLCLHPGKASQHQEAILPNGSELAFSLASIACAS